MRKYTVTEINRMRVSLHYHIVFGCSRSEMSESRTSEVFQEGEVDRRIEEQLRTCILTNIGPEELE